MSTTKLSKLLSPTLIGPIELSHRVVMAPLTRLRSVQPGDAVGALMVEYYKQRASEGGLIITEATAVSSTGTGYLGAPGIYDDAQIVGWKKVVEAVHAKGGRIFMQLWHSGRVSHVDLANGAAPLGASAVPFEGPVFTKSGWVQSSPNRALEMSEIPGIVELFREATRRAQAAGFDGVELHAANGYLLDQFLQDGSNQRTDKYGGSKENRTRLLLEVAEATASVVGRNRVGVRLSPSGKFLSMSDSNPEVTFDYVAEQLNQMGLAYLHIIEPRVMGSEAVGEGLAPVASARLSKIFVGPVIAAGGFEAESAEAVIEAGHASLVAFGRHFIANPDLPKRFEKSLPLNPYDRASFYGGDEHGYTDYPFVEAVGA